MVMLMLRFPAEMVGQWFATLNGRCTRGIKMIFGKVAQQVAGDGRRFRFIPPRTRLFLKRRQRSHRIDSRARLSRPSRRSFHKVRTDRGQSCPTSTVMGSPHDRLMIQSDMTLTGTRAKKHIAESWRAILRQCPRRFFNCACAAPRRMLFVSPSIYCPAIGM